MTAGTVVITGGILATVILLCIIAVLCYCRLQYYCCKKNDSVEEEEEEDEEEEEEEEEEPDLPAHSHLVMCNACSSRMVDGQGSPAPPGELNQHGAHTHCPTCSPYGSPFYIRTADMVRNGGDRVAYTPACYKEPGPPLSMATLQGYTLSRHGLLRDSVPNPRAISTDV